MSSRIPSVAAPRSSTPSGPSCHQGFQELLRLWLATINLFATSFSARLPVYFSPVADPQSAGTDAMMQPWDGLQAYAFPPFSLLHRVLSKVRQSRGLECALVAPFWPQRPWFPDLLVAVPVSLPQQRDLLRQPHFHRFHQNLHVLRLTAFRISSHLPAPSASLRWWLVSLPAADELPPRVNYQAKWAVYRAWCRRHGCSVSHPSVPKITSFLLYLRRTLSLSFSSMLSGVFRFVLPELSSLCSSGPSPLFPLGAPCLLFSCSSLGSVPCSFVSPWSSL